MRAQRASSVSLTGGKDKATRWPDVLRHLPRSCQTVFRCLSELSQFGGTELELSLRELAEIAGFSHEQVRRALRRLAGARLVLWLNRGPGRGHRSKIRILWYFGSENVTPQNYRAAGRPEHSFLSRIDALRASASPLHTSPLSSPRAKRKGALLESKDAPPGASLPAGAAKNFRRLAAALRRTALLPPGHSLWLYKLEGTVRVAILTALWRLRGRWRSREQLLAMTQLVLQRVRENPWCWRWWRVRGVRAVYALVTRWVKQALWLSERVCLASQDLPAEADPASLWGLPSWMPGLGDSAWGLAHGALGVVLAPSPGGTCWRWGDD